MTEGQRHVGTPPAIQCGFSGVVTNAIGPGLSPAILKGRQLLEVALVVSTFVL